MAKRALLIGINVYQMAGADLRGCVNDVEDLSAALIDVHGFKKNDITVLTDGAATKKAMQAGVKALLRDSKKGDVARAPLFRPRIARARRQRRRIRWPRRDPLSDRSRLGRSAQRRLASDDVRRRQGGGELHRHHGLLPFGNQHARRPSTRCPGQRAVSSQPVGPGSRRIEKASSEESDDPSSGARRGRPRKTKDIVKADLPEVLITGCRDVQTSADAFINGRYNGALTFSLVEAIRKGGPGLTYKELHDRASATLKTRKFDQVPQLEGRADRFNRPLFSV